MRVKFRIAVKAANRQNESGVGVYFIVSYMLILAKSRDKESTLVEVKLNEGESFDSMLRRFSKQVSQDMVLAEIRKRQHFESPTSLRKKLAAAKLRKSVKTTEKYA